MPDYPPCGACDCSKQNYCKRSLPSPYNRTSLCGSCGRVLAFWCSAIRGWRCWICIEVWEIPRMKEALAEASCSKNDSP